MKTNYFDVTEIMFDLMEQGFIYDEDENGFNMSQGEYAAVDEYIWECFYEYIQDKTEEEIIEIKKEIIEEADDSGLFWTGPWVFMEELGQTQAA